MDINTRIVQRELSENIDLSDAFHPVLRRIYLARNVCNQAQTDNQLKHLLPFARLKNIEQAVTLLSQALEQQQRILIVGDYDADGATSCAVAVRALRAFGAQFVDFLVPNRFEFGYGLTPEIVEVAKSRRPDLIVTVDNGIASLDGVEVAMRNNIRVLITDHHLPGNAIPAAEAIVNPNQSGDQFESKHLAGVGVIFYVMLALRTHLREKGWFVTKQIAEPNMAELLDLVALGTVADVVKLDHNNRILVAQGLARMRTGQSCPGILALLQVSGRDYRKVTSEDLGFCLGPRLNAAGRLDDMTIGIKCLLSQDSDMALEKAQVLDEFNRQRRHIEQTMREQAEQQLERMLENTEVDDIPPAICLFEPSFHEGVIGILAGRIKEKLHRPVIVFATSGTDNIKGSARSIPGLHIRDALDRVATAHPGLLSKFGGHAMAAGLTLRKGDFTRFAAAFTSMANELLNDDDLQRVLHCDGELAEEDINLSLAELLRNAGPWGQGFPAPQFAGRFELVQRRIVAEHHLKMVVRRGQHHFDAIAFRTTDLDWPATVREVQLVYRLDINEFNGQRSAQLLVEYVKPLG